MALADKDDVSNIKVIIFFLFQVETLLKLLTFMPTSNIEDLMEKHKKAPEKRVAQRKLAEEITLLVHGGNKINKNSHTFILALRNLIVFVYRERIITG